jgi:hypothetical protein
MDEFRCFTYIAFKQTYSVTSNHDTTVTISIVFVKKKLLSVLSWNGHVKQEYTGDKMHLFYSVTTETLTLWRRVESLKRFDLSTSFLPTPTAPTPPVVPSSSPDSSSFWHRFKINISDNPKLKDGT